MNKVLPWGVALIAVIVAAVSLNQPPQTIIKEVPTEVIREVPKEVIREVIKEVPKEVVKEVEKIVPATLTDLQKQAIQLGLNVAQSEWILASSQDVLKGVVTLNVAVMVDDAIKDHVKADELRTGIELELRKLGISINEKPDVNSPTLHYTLEGAYFEFEPEIFTYVESLSLTRTVYLPSGVPGDAWKFLNVEVYSSTAFGRAGKTKVVELSRYYEKRMKTFLNAYLKANPVSSTK